MSRHLTRSLGSLLLVAPMLAAPLHALAADASVTARPAESETEARGDALAGPAPRTTVAVSPMFAEMMQALERERVAIAELQARFARATSPAQALEIQRAIERQKLETEVAVLRIQVTHARREGKVEAAAQIEAAIEELTKPRVPRARVEAARPVTRAAR